MSTEDRLSKIEARLSAIERHLRQSAATAPSAPEKLQATVETIPATAIDTPVRPATSAKVLQPRQPSQEIRQPTSTPVTTILGWAGATALVLASVYLVILAIDAGWLTPVRQVMLSVLGGFVCIGIGLLLRDKDMHYASLLPAAGIVVLFLSLYGAHNYYHLIDTVFATSGIIAVCLISLWLNRMFLSDLYALFAVVGSYTAPMLLGGSSYSITDLIVYFACWSTVFSIFSIWVQQRSVYILAMYLALVIFDIQWSAHVQDAWLEALVFQTVHFAIFVAAASVYSARIREMSEEMALAHIPALALFYFVQYHILDKHIPALAPWIAVASAAILLASYFAVYRILNRDLAGGRTLISAYVALVLVHAGYIESVPDIWAPWVGLAVIPLAGLYAALRGNLKAPGMPLWFAVAMIFIANYFRIFTGYSMFLDSSNVPAHDLLALCYAIELYLGYYFLRKSGAMNDMGTFALYAGHIAIMAWAIQIFDSRFVVSLFWGAVALGCLMLSLKVRDKTLGQSSLLIFAASVFKALLYDIALAAPLIRIASLVVLGASLYLGGWLYKKVSRLEDD
ncbi:MAG: DUF2339 domain-containing protein [Nitrosomonadales bacterium]|nr:DUF2339 domain-containing protein [Nitrosomonadales bacterium]